jgi:Flp pilus assembly protein TadG
MLKIGSRSERGAALVEFAVVIPLFLVLVFGIMEAGWLFSQLTETRNAAREGARLAVVDFGTATQVAIETCNRAVLSSSGALVSISSSGTVSDPIGDPTASVSVHIENSYSSLTGFLDPIFNGASLDADVTMRVERPLVLLGPDIVNEPCP